MRLLCASDWAVRALVVLSLTVAAAPLSAACPASPPKVQVEQFDGQIQVQVLIDPRPCEEKYGAWLPLPDTNTLYRLYEYKVGGVLKQHYLLWFPAEPNHCYCYNPESKLYWGRWNKVGAQTTFTKASQKSTTVVQTQFEQQTATPIAPGTQAPMTPPAFPSNLPPDAFR